MFNHKLTLEEKIKLLTYIRGTYALTYFDEYASLSNAPQESPRAEYAYIGNALGIDFEKFYNDKEVHNLNVYHKEAIYSTYGCWFIPDAIVDVLYKELDADNQTFIISEGVVEAIDKKIRDIYNYYLGLAYPNREKPEKIIEYTPTGIFMDGQELYKREVIND